MQKKNYSKMNDKPIADSLIIENHLTDEQVALCVEFMLKRREEIDLQDDLKVHLQECDSCTERVIGLFEDVINEPAVLNNDAFTLENKKKTIAITKMFVRLSAAAILLILIATGAWFILVPTDSEKLFVKNFEPYPNIITIKSQSDQKLSMAFLLYEIRVWDSAILLFKSFADDTIDNPDVFFYLGNAYLAKGEPDQAIFWLNKSADISNKYSDQIKWYLALAYLIKRELITSEQYLEMLISSENFYKGRAEKLIRQIR